MLQNDAITGIAPLCRISASMAKQLASELTAVLQIGLSFTREVNQIVLASEALDILPEERQLLADAIIGLHYIRLGLPGDQQNSFGAKLVAAVRKSPSNSFSDEELISLGENASILAEPRTLRASTKAQLLRTEFDRIFAGAQIFTDIRPIFDDDLKKPLLASLVTHTIKISFHTDGNGDALSIVADAEDLMNLQRMIARALEKSAALISLTKEIEHKFGPILDRENDE